MCCIGTAIGTQQQKTATMSRIMTRLGDKPRLAVLRGLLPAVPLALVASGGACRKAMVRPATATTTNSRKQDHGPAPAYFVDAVLQERRPDRAGDRLS